MTTCSSCAARSARSPRWPTAGRRRRCAPCSTTRRATWRRFAAPRDLHLAAAAARGSRQDGFRRLLPLYPAGRRAPAGLRPRRRRLQQQRVRPRRPARPAARCTSATATRRSATPGTSARPRCRAARALPGRRCAGARPRPPLGPRGEPARDALHRELRDHPPADRRLLRPRLGRRAPARRRSTASRPASPRTGS